MTPPEPLTGSLAPNHPVVWPTLLVLALAGVVVPFASGFITHWSYFLWGRFGGGFRSFEWVLAYLHLPRTTLSFLLLFVVGMVPSLWRHPRWVLPLLFVLGFLVPFSGALGGSFASVVNQFVLSVLQSPNRMAGFVSHFMGSFVNSIQNVIVALLGMRMVVFLSGLTCRPPWWPVARPSVWTIRKLFVLTAIAALFIGTLRAIDWQTANGQFPFLAFQAFAVVWSAMLQVFLVVFWCWFAITPRRPRWPYAIIALGVLTAFSVTVVPGINNQLSKGFFTLGVWRFFHVTMSMSLASGFAFAIVRALGYRFGPRRGVDAIVPGVGRDAT